MKSSLEKIAPNVAVIFQAYEVRIMT